MLLGTLGKVVARVKAFAAITFVIPARAFPFRKRQNRRLFAGKQLRKQLRKQLGRNDGSGGDVS
jgi:hypothetical protein